MTKPLIALAAMLALTAPAFAQEQPKGEPSPGEIVAQAQKSEWKAIPEDDLLVMTLAPPDRGPGQASAEGKPRTVIIQLMPAPFSQGWVDNIRTFARAHWYDDITVNRVQDNYVVQWGDVNYDNPEATGEAKPLPAGLKVMEEDTYTVPWGIAALTPPIEGITFDARAVPDNYARQASFRNGWPIADDAFRAWPVHCYGMVGVGRNYSPDTGSGAELYTVIGTPPRHLDRNIALVGRVIEGMEYLSSLPRGHGDLGFYAADEADKRTPILTVRVASDLPAAEQPHFEYLSTDSQTFARYADARANRRDPFFIVPAGGADICNIPVPIRRVTE